MELPTGIRDLNIPDIRGCVPSRHIEHWWLVFTASTVFDAVAFILSIIPCLTEYRASTQSGIARIIVRDGVLFFALCLGANLANLVSIAWTSKVSCRQMLMPSLILLQRLDLFRVCWAHGQPWPPCSSSYGNASHCRSSFDIQPSVSQPFSQEQSSGHRSKWATTILRRLFLRGCRPYRILWS